MEYRRWRIVDGRWKMEDRGPFRPRSKLIVIKEGTPEETKRKAFESYFTLTGSTELMRAAWGAG